MKEILFHPFIHTIEETIKLIPFLFIAFIIIEFIEHKLSKKNEKILKESGKFGPLLGGLLGLIPQCGFSVLATNLYITRIISLGSLISIYLATSDEMLIILIADKAPLPLIITILAFKLVIGVICGYIIDLLCRKRKNEHHIHELCEHDECHCEEENIFISSLKHTLKTTLFIFISLLIVNIIFHNWGEAYLSKLLLKNNIVSPLISSLIALIPSCGSSVIITELYLLNQISFGTLISGLLTNSGIAIMLLFKNNKNIKENITILLTIYSIWVITCIIINLITMIV